MECFIIFMGNSQLAVRYNISDLRVEKSQIYLGWLAPEKIRSSLKYDSAEPFSELEPQLLCTRRDRDQLN